MAPLVSFCLPASRADVAVALATVLVQEPGDFEVVVADETGGGLRDIVERAGDGRVRYLANERRLGFVGNHTRVLDEARGELVAIVHDDDQLLPGFLATLLPAFADDPGLGFAFADCLVDRGDGARRRGVPLPEGRYDDLLPELVHEHFMIPTTTLMRRRVWTERTSPLPEHGLADVALYVDAALAGWAFRYVDDVVAVRQEGLGGEQLSGDEERFRANQVRMWEAYRFADAAVEALRRDRLAWALVGLAGVHLKQGRPAAALGELAHAREVDPRASWARRHVLEALARRPGVLPIARRVHGALRR